MALQTGIGVSNAGRPSPLESTAGDFATHGPVHLDVTDRERALGFWRDLVGLELLGEADGALTLGVPDAELLVLHPGATSPVRRGHSGLYHVAIHLPSEVEFARVLGRLLTVGYHNAPTDHIMHWATYLDDPDGNGLELSFETLDRFDGYIDRGGRPVVRDSEGRLRGATEPLDLEQVFGHLTDRDLGRPLPAGTRIGHVHLHVAALEPALDFYEAIGFERNLTEWRSLGMTDMTAQGSFPHRLALNVWQGPGAPPRPAGTAGLRRLVVHFRSAEDLAAATARLAAYGARVEPEDGGALATDPSGNRVLLAVAGPEASR